MEVADRVVAALGVARVGEGVGPEPAQAPLVDDHLDLLDEVGRRAAAVALEAVEVARLEGLDERLERLAADVVDALAVDDGAVGVDLEEHAELGAVVGPAERDPGDDRVGLGDGPADPRAAGRSAASRS